jgi:hypothetical protein
MEQINSQVPERTKQAIVDEAEERGVSQSTVIREYMEERYEDDVEPAPRGSTVIPATIAATLVVGLAFLSAGDTAVGRPLAVVSALGLFAWGTASLAGWDRLVADLLTELREGYHDVGGVRGFFRVAWARWEDEHVIEEASTPVERVARLDVYLPLLFLVAFGVLGVTWSALQLGALSVLSPTGALALAGLLTLVVFSIPATIFLAALAQLALVSLRGAVGADSPEA